MKKLSVDKWIAKHFTEDTVINEDRLIDNACSECGSRGPFRVKVIDYADLSDAGFDQDCDGEDDGTDWRCPECDEEGKRQDFYIPGLDQMIEKMQRNKHKQEDLQLDAKEESTTSWDTSGL